MRMTNVCGSDMWCLLQLLGFSNTATSIMVQFTTAGAAVGFLIGGAWLLQRVCCSVLPRLFVRV